MKRTLINLGLELDDFYQIFLSFFNDLFLACYDLPPYIYDNILNFSSSYMAGGITYSFPIGAKLEVKMISALIGNDIFRDRFLPFLTMPFFVLLKSMFAFIWTN